VKHINALHSISFTVILVELNFATIKCKQAFRAFACKVGRLGSILSWVKPKIFKMITAAFLALNAEDKVQLALAKI